MGLSFRPAVRGPLRARQAGPQPAINEIAWSAQKRLHERYRTLVAKGKNNNQVITAVGRELLGSSGPSPGRSNGRCPSPRRRKIGQRRGDGSRSGGEKENPPLFYAAGVRPQPARLVRGSSRRIMTMRFRPANIRVINRRV